MKYFNECIKVVKSRVASVVRTNEKAEFERNFDIIAKFIRDINRARNMIHDWQAAVKSKTGTLLTVKELAEIELPNIFKALLMARSVRFAHNYMPDHPDLKDYKDLGGGIEVIEAEVEDVMQACDAITAILSRNKISVNNCKVGDVWLNQTLADVFNNCTLKISNAKDVERLFNFDGSSISLVPVPLIDVSSLVSVENFTTNSVQWGSYFNQCFKI